MRIAKNLVKTEPKSGFASDFPSLTSNVVSVDPWSKCIIFGPLWEEVSAGGVALYRLYVSVFSICYNCNFFLAGATKTSSVCRSVGATSYLVTG